MRWFVAFLAVLIGAASPSLAAPPHPDYARKIAAGEAPVPEYIRQLREKGQPKLRGERKVGKVVREPKRPQQEDGVLGSQPAPGDGITDGTIATEAAPPAPLAPPALGTQNALALLASFSDVPPTEIPTYFDTLVFGYDGAAFGAVAPSLSHYYRQVSQDAFTVVTGDFPSAIQCDSSVSPCTAATPAGWLPLPGTKAAYQANLRAMAVDAVAAADADIDFSLYDNDGDGYVDYLILVHVGSGEEFDNGVVGDDIWSQTLSISPILTNDGVSIDTFSTVPEYWFTGRFGQRMTTGVYAHEFGHLLGLPDLYDYGFDSYGVGDWELMSYGMWNGTLNRAESPSWISAWGRVALGWVEPVAPAVDLPGVTFAPVEQGGPVYYLWNHGSANSEFFLVENRQKLTAAETYDYYIPGQGLLVWHIDETMPNNNTQIYSADAVLRQSDCEWPNHYKVALQQADGYMNLEGNVNAGDLADPYPGSSTNRSFAPPSVPPGSLPNSGSYANCDSLVAIRNITVVGTSITADLEVVAGNAVPVALAGSASTPEDTPEVSAVEIVLEATDADTDPLTYQVVAYPAHGSLSGTAPALAYTPDENFHGQDSFTFVANDGYVDSNTATVTITVTPVNDPPTLNAIADLPIDEDAGLQTVSLDGITAGPNETEAVTVSAVSSNTALIPDPTVSYTDPAETGSLGFTPVGDASGTATITVTVDDGQAADNTVVRMFLVTVAPVNDAPTLAALDPLNIGENAGLQTVGLSGIGAGGGESQTLTVTASSSNTALIPDPAVTYTSPDTTGSLGFTPVASVYGSATITVTVDDGQSLNNTVVRTFLVTVNDPPTAICLSNSLVAEDADVGTLVGTFCTTDSNAGDAFTYELVSGTGDTENAIFVIVGDELRTAASLDFTMKNPFSVRVRSTDLAGASTETVFTVSPPVYVLWTRPDLGRASLWQVDPSLPTGPDQLLRSVSLYSAAGVGAPWRATSYTHVSSTEGYVLWTHPDLGKASLWQVDPSLPTGPDQLVRSVLLYSAAGVGAPWQATSYTHVSETEGYVLWTRADIGKASLWQVDPSLPTGPDQLLRSMSLYSAAGIGEPWQATSYTHVSDTEGYVLWTRADLGKASLWRIDPSLPTGPEQLVRSVFLYSAAGVGAPWQATSYTHVSETEGYVLWTRADIGGASLWRIDPSLPTGPEQLVSSVWLYSAGGVGAPWQATSLFRTGPVVPSSPASPDMPLDMTQY